MTKFVVINFFDPKRQAIAAGVVAIFFMLVGRFVFAAPIFPWLASSAFLLLFTVFNNGMSIFAGNYAAYARQSLWSFIALLLGLGGFSYLLSGQSIYDVPTFKIIYTVFVIAHFTLMALCVTIRRAVAFFISRDRK